ncbi:MAG: hypothetical protein ABEJ61_03615 [Haloferacaceae archaeon]
MFPDHTRSVTVDPLLEPVVVLSEPDPPLDPPEPPLDPPEPPLDPPEPPEPLSPPPEQPAMPAMPAAPAAAMKRRLFTLLPDRPFWLLSFVMFHSVPESSSHTE